MQSGEGGEGMKFWMLFLCCFIFVAWLDSRILEANSVKKIRAAGKRNKSKEVTD